MNMNQKLSITRQENLMRYFLPYCLQRIKGNVYLPLNRNYKPIGVTTKEWVEYENYQHLYVRFSRCPSKMTIEWHYAIKNKNGTIDKLFFYGDGLDSREMYFEKYLAVMSKAKLIGLVRFMALPLDIVRPPIPKVCLADCNGSLVR